MSKLKSIVALALYALTVLIVATGAESKAANGPENIYVNIAMSNGSSDTLVAAVNQVRLVEANSRHATLCSREDETIETKGSRPSFSLNRNVHPIV